MNPRQILASFDLFSENLGKIYSLEELTAAELSLDYQNEEGNSTLIATSYHGDGASVRLLLEKKASPDLQNNNGDTALSIAARKGGENHPVIVHELLARRAALHLKNIAGNTPLIGAVDAGCKNSHVTIIKELLENKAALDLQNNKGQTALKLAYSGTASPIKEKIVDTLMAKSAFLEDKDKGEALIFAASAGMTKMVDYLFIGSTSSRTASWIDATDARGDTALMKAVRATHEHIVNTLLLARASVNLSNKAGNAALALAKYDHPGCEKVIDLLLEHAADVNLQDKQGKSALMNAVVTGPLEVVNKLLTAGASVNLKNHAKESALDIIKWKCSLYTFPYYRGKAVFYLDPEKAIKKALKSAAAQEEKDQKNYQEKKIALRLFFLGTREKAPTVSLPTSLVAIIEDYTKPTNILG